MTESIRPSLEERAGVYGALSDPRRLAICDLLELSDRTPSELAARLDISSSLLAHHLSVLGAAGLTTTVSSSGDRRRRYVRLRRGVAEVLRTATSVSPASVLFVCTQNSARSQLALALWQQRSRIPATSAGTRPARSVHAGARRAAARHGLDLSRAVPRALAPEDLQSGLVVTVCDEANESLATPGLERLHWSIPDPVAAGSARAFEETFEELVERVSTLHTASGDRRSA